MRQNSNTPLDMLLRKVIRMMRTTLMVLTSLGLVAACSSTVSAKMAAIKSGDNYRILAEAKADAKDALKGSLMIVIEPTSGWKMEKDKGPAGFTLEPAAGLKIGKKAWKKADAKWEAGGKRIRFEIPYGLAAKGEKKVKLKFRFVICTDKLCQMKRFELEYPIKG